MQPTEGGPAAPVRPVDGAGGGPDVGGPRAAAVAAATERYAELSRQARNFAARARSEATTRAYDADWRHFTAWCARYGQVPLPAAPQTLANYLADHAPAWRDATDAELARASGRVVDGQVRTGARPATLRRRLAAIGVIHRAAGHDNPAAHQLVRDVLDGIARTPDAAGRRQARAATADPLTAMLAVMDPEQDPRDARDAAVLLLGMTGALRRSELAALRIGDVALERDEGLEVSLSGSKTDQHHHGHTVAIPDLPGEVSPRDALARWVDWLARRPHQDPADPTRMTLAPGAPLWRPVSRRQGPDPRARIGVRPLSDRGISEIVKARARAVGLEGSWSGHSLRRGFATDAYAGGADEVEIMRHGRWVSATTMRGYLEEGTRFRATHPVRALTFPTTGGGDADRDAQQA